MASSKVTLEQIFAWAGAGDLESLSTKVPVHMLSKSDATGLRALHVAASKGQVKVLEWLVDDERRDPGVNKLDEDARSPLHWAAWHGQAEAVQALLEMGAIRDRPTRTGFTALHYACFSGDLKTVKLLVEFGAKIDARDESQQMPKDVARRFGHDEVADYMENEAPKITIEARKKYAYMGGNEDAMKNVSDPIVEAIQVTEEENLERIVQTASKVAAEQPLVSPPTARSQPFSLAVPWTSSVMQKQLIFGALVFTATLALGAFLGRRSSAPHNSRNYMVD